LNPDARYRLNLFLLSLEKKRKIPATFRRSRASRWKKKKKKRGESIAGRQKCFVSYCLNSFVGAQQGGRRKKGKTNLPTLPEDLRKEGEKRKKGGTEFCCVPFLTPFLKLCTKSSGNERGMDAFATMNSSPNDQRKEEEKGGKRTILRPGANGISLHSK